MANMTELYIGLMSGTSMDGVDAALVDFSTSKPVVTHVKSAQIAPDLRAELLALNSPGDNELHRAALAANALAHTYAQAVHALLSASGLPVQAVRAIGAHGQTLRHQPRQHTAVPNHANSLQASGYTIQLNNPALLAELTGIDVVADFRSRDVAAGGQGAPLAPFFHRAWFSPTGAAAGQPIGVLNLGGISNLSILQPDGTTLGFDCGPGNALLDMWCQQHTGVAFDDGGSWGAGGVVNPALLQAMLAEPYFALPPPKSTGRDLFNRTWLDAHLKAFDYETPQNIQKTLVELTVSPIGYCASSYEKNSGLSLTEIIVCGGGAFNRDLMGRLQAHMPRTAIVSSAQRGLPPQDVEATAFAWLARQCVLRQALPLTSVTGARGARVLGCIYPA
jgi:anhydro-N-acetylmuramic acid kinase